METWIQQALGSEHAGITVLIAVFLLGIISLFTCSCNFSIIAILAGYSKTIGSSGKSKSIVWNGFFFLIGFIVSMSIIGGIIGYASELINYSFGIYWKIAAGLISIFFGLFSMDMRPFKIPGVNLNTFKHKSGLIYSLVLGFAIGGVTLATSSCCNPVLPIVLAASFVKGSFIWGIFLLFAYSLGYGLTLSALIIGIGLGLGKTSKTFSLFGNILKNVGGILMIIFGFYLLITI